MKGQEDLTIEQMVEKFNQGQVEIQAKQTELENAIENKSDKTTLEAIEGEIKKMSKERVSQNDILIAHGKELKKLQAPGQVKKTTFIDLAEKALKDNAQNFADIKEKKINGFTFDIDLKLVDDASMVNGSFGLRVPGIGEIPYRKSVMEPLFNAGNFGENSGGSIKYVDQNSITDGSDWIANCSAIPESDVDWIERTLTAKKAGAHIPICIDTMENYNFVETEVRTILFRQLDHKLDEGLLLGTGAGNEITGIDSIAPDWVAGAFALAVPTPTIYDVISTGVTQISVAGADNFNKANVTLMNEIDIEKMRLTKDANGNTLINPFHDFSTQTIRGTRIVSTPLVPANQMYIGDFSYGTVYTLRGITLEVTNSHAEYFLSDIIVIKATLRKELLVRNVNVGAFLHVPSISQAITDLTKP